MVAKVHKLMYPHAVNGGSRHITSSKSNVRQIHRSPEAALPYARSLRPELKKQREESSETVDADDGEGSRDSAEVVVGPVTFGLETGKVTDSRKPSMASLRSHLKRQWEESLNESDGKIHHDTAENVSPSKKLASGDLQFEVTCREGPRH